MKLLLTMDDVASWLLIWIMMFKMKKGIRIRDIESGLTDFVYVDEENRTIQYDAMKRLRLCTMESVAFWLLKSEGIRIRDIESVLPDVENITIQDGEMKRIRFLTMHDVAFLELRQNLNLEMKGIWIRDIESVLPDVENITIHDDKGDGRRHDRDSKMKEFRNFAYWITALFITILVSLLSANKRQPEVLFRLCGSLVIGATSCCIAMLMLILICPSRQRALPCLKMMQYLTIGLLFVVAVLVFTLL